jgi:hypothetical protein
MGHEHRFRDVRDESGLPPTPERLRHRGETDVEGQLQKSATCPAPLNWRTIDSELPAGRAAQWAGEYPRGPRAQGGPS